MKHRRLWLSSLLLVTLLFGVACSGSDAESGADAAGGGGDGDLSRNLEAPEQSDSDAVADYGSGTSGSGGSGSGSGGGYEVLPQSLPPSGPRVIKTAELRIEIDRDGFGDSVQDVISAAERAGGFVVSTSSHGEDARRGSIVVRVPSDRFESVLGEIKGVGAIKGESIAGEDVSQEFVDLEARLRNYEVQEKVLLRLMERSVTVADTIRVQRELEGIQLEIERLRGRIRYLDDQTSLSTIRVDLSEEGTAAPAPDGTLAKAWDQAKDTFMAVITALIVGAGFVVPLGLLALIAWWLIRMLRPRWAGFAGDRG